METVSRVINTASNAIWGEGSRQQTTGQEHDEPISGVQGAGGATDPYDAGNREEQPEAPATDTNTAPQDPKLSGQAKNANSAEASTGSTTENSQPNVAAGGSSSSKSAGSNPASSGGDKEQRGEGEKSQHESQPERSVEAVMADHHVSKEALQGPQGPAPKTAEEFEKDSKRKKDQKPPSDDASKGSEKTDTSSGSGKSSHMSKMKETLNKVAHPRHG